MGEPNDGREADIFLCLSPPLKLRHCMYAKVISIILWNQSGITVLFSRVALQRDLLLR